MLRQSPLHPLRFIRNLIVGLTIVSVTILPRILAQQAQENADESKMNIPLMIASFERDPQLSIKIAADDTKVSHPIAFAIDDFGRVFIAESYRYIDSKGGWTDIRARMSWMDTDLASRSIEDRRKLYESRLGAELEDWKTASEQVRLLENPDESGVFRDSSIFADDFHDLLDGTIAGLLPTRNRLYVANIPHLWELRGVESRKATARKPLHTGFGVRLGYLGHDLHGLCWGPDGRLYFSLGDRGAHIEKDGKTLIDIPDTGGVFRCEADGSNLELYARGLRNPQELAFDALGNLWTCDNNADRGDKARWVWILPGADSGWRVGYQHLDFPVPLGAWTSEKIWYPEHPDQAGHIVPPVANLAQGPSGVAAHPGTGLPSEFTGQFLVCDYLGEIGGIYAVSVKKKGAGFEMLPPKKFIWNAPANDVDFANDGSVLFSVWTKGIDRNSGGALFRVESPGLKDDALARSTAEILKQDPGKADFETLGKWLEHPDMRVRRHAQFELVRRGQPAADTFLRSIRKESPLQARISALWGLAQLQRLKSVPLPEESTTWVTDPDPDFRATVARVLGECNPPGASDVLVAMLDDLDDHVKLRAALALAESPSQSAVPVLKNLAGRYASKDAWLRHAISAALAKCSTADALVASKSAESEAVRHASLIALRKLKDAGVAVFLDDRSPKIVADAARAIYEERIEDAFDKLAAFDPARTIETGWGDIAREAVLRRWIHINARLGKLEQAKALARFAGDPRFPEHLRAEALETLGRWSIPRPFDGVEGIYFDVSKFDRAPDAARAQSETVLSLLTDRKEPESIRLAAIAFAEAWLDQKFEAALSEIIVSNEESAAIRARSLQTLANRNSARASDLILKSIDTPVEELKLVAIASIDRLPVKERLPIIRQIIDSGMIRESQKALQALARSLDDDGKALVDSLVDRYVRDELPVPLRLEVREAVDKSGSKAGPMRKKLEAWRNVKSRNDPLVLWADAAEGGDPAAGEALFRNRADFACIRCHQPSNSVAQRVGPSLGDVGSRLSPRQIIEAIVNPNASIATGFETVAVARKDGTIVSGLLKEEKPDSIDIVTEDGKVISIVKTDIDERTKGSSLMPERLMDRMSLRELRDIVAWLSSQKTKAPAESK